MIGKTMTAAVALTAILALNGCNEAAPPANAAPDTSAVAKTESAPTSNVAALALQTAEDWPGEYRATIEGGQAELSIDAAKAGLHDVELGVGGAGNSGSCGGGAEGKGTAKGNVMSVAIVAEFMDSGTCTMKFTRTGNRIAVSNGTCPPLTGAACTLEGSYTRSGGKQAAPAVSGPSWNTEGTASGVRAVEDSRIYLQHHCWKQAGQRSDGLSIGAGPSLWQGTNSANGGEFQSAFDKRTRTATLRVFVTGQPVRTLTFTRTIEPEVDWGFNVALDNTALSDIKRASHFELRIGQRTLTFSGAGATRAIGSTQCQEVYD